ncbi:MAG: nicotinate-nucleotide adenylyltransferase [Bacteroidales bacterium]|nr:nicotinate-nucleotide adenylyltransferase [Bacteroidales bacterium]
MMKVGLYFGSFNPVHNGHITVAKYMHSHYPIDEIWYVLSPQNPLKKAEDLLDEASRLKLLEVAIQPYSFMKISTIEFEMPKPSYTYLTMRELKKRYPDTFFYIIMGNDVMLSIDLWKNYQEILDENVIYLYPRNDIELLIISKNIIQTDAPSVMISSSDIRNKIKLGESIQDLLPDEVYEIIESEKFYQ